jgi:hypothetical protein
VTAVAEPEITDEALVADYHRVMAALDISDDWRKSLAYGLALYGIRRIMDERHMEYPQCPVAANNPKS